MAEICVVKAAGPGATGRGIAAVGLILLCVSSVLPFPAIYQPRSILKGDRVVGLLHNPDTFTQSRAGLSPAALIFGEGLAGHFVTTFPGLAIVFGFIVTFCHLGGWCRRLGRLSRLMRALTPGVCMAFLVCGLASAYRAFSVWINSLLVQVWLLAAETGEMGGREYGSMLAKILGIWSVLSVGCVAILFARRELRRATGMLFFGLAASMFVALLLMCEDSLQYIGFIVAAGGCAIVAIGALCELISLRIMGTATYSGNAGN